MPITTCVDMVASALRTASVVGVGQTPLAEDANDAFDLLVEVVETWKRERFMAWRCVELVIPSTGAQSYVLPDRPPRLDAAFARLLTGQTVASIENAGPIDYPLQIIDSQSDYAAIALKQMSTFPAAVWYQSGYPTGLLYPWPIPPADQYEMHVLYRAPLPTYTALTDPLDLPPEYVRALRYEMAVLLRVNYGMAPMAAHAVALTTTKATIKASNAHVRSLAVPVPGTPSQGSGGISGAVGPHQSVIVLDSGLPVLG